MIVNEQGNIQVSASELLSRLLENTKEVILTGDGGSDPEEAFYKFMDNDNFQTVAIFIPADVTETVLKRAAEIIQKKLENSFRNN